MGKLANALNDIREMDKMASGKSEINQVHPLIKLAVTVFYITCAVSFDKYDLLGLLPMAVYPFIVFRLAGISLRSFFGKLRVILPLLCFIGIFNPIFDRVPVLKAGNIVITGGIISMVTLMLKGVYTLAASFLLIATTGIEGICYGLELLHIPGVIVTQILLTYRYVFVLLGEADAVTEAYSLRAPGEKGVKYRVWGSLIGQLLFRSIDRAGNLYDSMLLRGFKGKFSYASCRKCAGKDYIYLIVWLIIILSLGILPRLKALW